MANTKLNPLAIVDGSITKAKLTSDIRGKIDGAA